MLDRKPIKRSEELVSLSRDHHDALLLSWKINTGINRSVETVRIVAYVLFFFDNYLNVHFEEEENYLFPLLREDNPERREAEADHRLFREMILAYRTTPEISYESLVNFADLLSKHIRFEERVLFNVIERQASAADLNEVKNKLASHTNFVTEWHDQFWLNKNE
jgi:hemerythrin-like domain-containing protein